MFALPHKAIDVSMPFLNLALEMQRVVEFGSCPSHRRGRRTSHFSLYLFNFPGRCRAASGCTLVLCSSWDTSAMQTCFVRRLHGHIVCQHFLIEAGNERQCLQRSIWHLHGSLALHETVCHCSIPLGSVHPSGFSSRCPPTVEESKDRTHFA